MAVPKRSTAVSRLSGLSEHTQLQFAIKRSLMRAVDCRSYERHNNQRKELMKKLAGLQHKVDTGKSGVGFDHLKVLRVWLTKRAIEIDQLHANHFLQTGAKPRLMSKPWAPRAFSGNRRS